MKATVWQWPALLGLVFLAAGCGGVSPQNDPVEPTAKSTGANDTKHRAKLHTELGSMYFQGGANSVALEELGIAIGIDSTYFQAFSVRGLVYAALKENAKAEADFARALALAPNDPEVNNNYGWYLCQSGREAQSIASFMKAVRSPLYETPERAYTNAGVCALKGGDLDGAQSYLLKAIQLSKDGAALPRFHMATLLYRRGVYEEARFYLNEAARQVNPNPPEILWLGLRLERRLGNKAAEGTYASQLRSRYPASAEYQEFLRGNFE